MRSGRQITGGLSNSCVSIIVRADSREQLAEGVKMGTEGKAPSAQRLLPCTVVAVPCKTSPY